MTPFDPSLLQRVLPAAQMDRSPVPATAPVAQGAPAQPEPQQTLPRVPTEQPAAQGQTQGLAFPQAGQAGRSAAQERQTSLQEQGSGISRIHNPVLRTLAQIGDVAAGTFAPRAEQLIPGTEGNYALHLARAGNAVRGEETQRAAEDESGLKRANAAHLGAETQTLIPAQADEAAARAESLRNPKEKEAELNEFRLWHQQNPDAPVSDYLKLVADNKNKNEAPKTLLEKAMVDHPEWKAEDLQAFMAKDTKSKEWSPEDSALISSLGGDVGKPETLTRPLLQKFLDMKKDKTPVDHGVSFIDPASGKLVRVEPGGVVPKGALSPGGVNTEAVNADKETQAATKAKNDAARDYKLAQTLVANPSPTNDLALVMQYVGATKPDSLGKLRLNNNEVNLVYGTRSSLGDLEALVSKVQTGQSLTPKQRQDMLNTMKILAESRSDVGGGGGGGNAQSVRARDPQGVLREAPAGTPLPAGWKAEK